MNIFHCIFFASVASSAFAELSSSSTSSEVIGSSVVTSVSVILGNDHIHAGSGGNSVAESPRPLQEKVQPVVLTILEEAGPPPPQFLRSLHPQRKEESERVQGVIDTLKTIVKAEQQKQETTNSSSSHQNPNPNYVPGTTLSSPGGEDDELESTSNGVDPFNHPTTDAIDDFAKHVVNMVAVEEQESESENDTATSAEVHDAIHKISGAILSVEDGEKGAAAAAAKETKPVLEIVTDVLSSINSARNSTESSTKRNATTTTTTRQPSTTTTPKPRQTTTKKTGSYKTGSSSSSSKPGKKAAPPSSSSATKANTSSTAPTHKPSTTNRPSSTPKSSATRKPPPSPPQIQENKLKTELKPDEFTKKPSNPKIQLPMIIMLEPESTPEVVDADKIPGLPSDPQESEKGEVDDEWSAFPKDDMEAHYSTLRPYITPPTKGSSSSSSGHKRPMLPQQGTSPSSTKTNEFYDDEIFGYDPYQTFFHGVYVPVVEVGTLTELQHEEDSSSAAEDEFEATTVKSVRRPGAGKKPGKKPMPVLPDHLHRPRPSHLQYQHGAADDTDPETGLLNVNYEHAGNGYVPDGVEMMPDKLASHSRPTLAPTVRRNFTEHHDHHVSHQHGHGGAGGAHHGDLHHHLTEQANNEKRPNFPPAPKGNPGLEATLTSLDEEKRGFVDVNNRIALRLLSSLTNPVSHSSTHYGNMAISPFTITSSLGMMFLGARGPTATQLDGFLQMDDVLSFNPHMLYHNVTESFLSQPNTAAAMIRLLITDKDKGDVLEFYKTRVQHFYEARVEEVDYKFAGHLAQSIINQMIRAQIQRHSYEMVNYSLPLNGPMSLITAAFFDGQFSGHRDTSVDNMNFIHLAALHQGPVSRRLFQIPAFAMRGNFRANYDKELDATAVEIPYTTRDLSLILILPGKSGEFAFGGVTSLKSRLNLDSWTKLMRGFYPRDTFKVIIPRFRHQTAVNLSHTLNRFGLIDIFEPTLAKFKGINGLSDLYLDQNMVHFSEFGTWEKLSDTLNENNNRNLDLIRILRPHVREHYGQFGGEPMSVNEWIFKNQQQSQRSQSGADEAHFNQNQYFPQLPDDVSRLRIELERLTGARRQPVQFQSHPSDESLVPHTSSYSRVRGAEGSTATTVQFRPRRLKAELRTAKARKYYRQENPPLSPPTEQETVLRFERPFLYALRHNPTGMILMTGQYTEPVTEIFE